MVVSPVDERHPYGRTSESLHGTQSTETGSDDDDVGLLND
jgi:hypothetical protein